MSFVPASGWDDLARKAFENWKTITQAIISQVQLENVSRKRTRLALVSPLPPERSGIADYCAELIPALAEYYDIELVVAQDRVSHPWGTEGLPVRDVAWLKANARKIDRVLYHLGNSRFHAHMLPLLQDVPGVVVLHDFYLGHLCGWMDHHVTKGFWTKELYSSHGFPAIVEWHKNQATALFEYPCSFSVIQCAQGIIFHSEQSRQLARQWYGESISREAKVIPLLRVPSEPVDKVLSRKQLGFGNEDFVICSFGHLGPTKLNHRLLECWLGSSLACDKHCHLVFVGESPGGDYDASLLQTIRASGVGDRLRITGFAAPEMFRQYLMAADLAVQLRTMWRGETSAAVMDCMNYGLPVIVNANGSMADLDRQAVWMLSDQFEDAQLVDALETLKQDFEMRRALGERAREIILKFHSPSLCAEHYAEAIERFHQRAETGTPALLRAIAAQDSFAPSEAELLEFSRDISCNIPLRRPAKRLLLDVTATSRNDLKTGIERVARALLLTLSEAPPEGFRIEPVYLSNHRGQHYFRYARRFMLTLLDCPTDALGDEIVEPESGDVLLALDLSGDILVQADRAGLLKDYRNRGTAIYFVVFDLLPIRNPVVFPPGADQSHAEWLHVISKCDGAISISKAVANDLANWRVEAGLEKEYRRPFRIGWFHLGADIAGSSPSKGLPDTAESTLRRLQSRRSFLMVGTIEPRKGYLQAIEAFTQLWSNGVDVNLVIVGKEGWLGLPEDMRRTIPETVKRLRTHSELNKRLFWLDGISDEYLEKTYAASSCLIAASYGEGFGLPLIEAAQHKLPIIARDIAVFREVAEEHAYYFRGLLPEELAHGVKAWLSLFDMQQHPKPEQLSWLTWKESANQLIRWILPDERASQQKNGSQ
jgi:glycosyltransferase involved in cell wall biosynthesis